MCWGVWTKRIESAERCEEVEGKCMAAKDLVGTVVFLTPCGLPGVLLLFLSATAVALWHSHLVSAPFSYFLPLMGEQFYTLFNKHWNIQKDKVLFRCLVFHFMENQWFITRDTLVLDMNKVETGTNYTCQMRWHEIDWLKGRSCYHHILSIFWVSYFWTTLWPYGCFHYQPLFLLLSEALLPD